MNESLPTLPPRIFRPPQYGETILNGPKTYRLGICIGQGSFGCVYECTDEWGNELAAKVLQPLNETYDAVRGRWLKELESLMSFRHPNITFVYDAFEYQDTFYLIMERCSGTLTSLINLPDVQGDIWLPFVARDILQAVCFMHDNGYVHKDLHPGNVFISEVRDRMIPNKPVVYQFKVGDLGIARLEDDIDIFNTLLAQWMLPPEFLNPLEFGRVGLSVDIYHAGLLFLGLLLGMTPVFTHEEILQGKPRQLAESLPSPYGPVISKALRRHVSARPASARHFWREIKVVADAV